MSPFKQVSGMGITILILFVAREADEVECKLESPTRNYYFQPNPQRKAGSLDQHHNWN
jgi:hypothetical protein